MSKIKILIAEDDPGIQKLYEKSLPEEEFIKRFCSNGIYTLQVYKMWNPDIVILDIGLPEMNGYFILRKIRETIKDKETPIIMATGISDKQKISDCKMMGISAYIVKPFNYKEIKDVVIKAHEGGKMPNVGIE